MPQPGSFLWVAVGGACGACLRYLLTVWLLQSSHRFPLGTFVANVSGAFAAGFLIGCLIGRLSVGSPAHLFWVIGFLGSYTTMSTFTVDTIRLFNSGATGLAMLYLSISVFGCLIATGIGMLSGRWLLQLIGGHA